MGVFHFFKIVQMVANRPKFLMFSGGIERETSGKKWVNQVISFKINFSSLALLTHILPMLHFCTPWKRPKTEGFLTLSGGTEM